MTGPVIFQDERVKRIGTAYSIAERQLRQPQTDPHFIRAQLVNDATAFGQLSIAERTRLWNELERAGVTASAQAKRDAISSGTLDVRGLVPQARDALVKHVHVMLDKALPAFDHAIADRPAFAV